MDDDDLTERRERAERHMRPELVEIRDQIARLVQRHCEILTSLEEPDESPTIVLGWVVAYEARNVEREQLAEAYRQTITPDAQSISMAKGLAHFAAERW